MMTRTRAERRHNTRIKTQQRLNSDACNASLTPSGERKRCSMCEMCKPYEQAARASLDSKRLSAFILSQY